MCQWEQTLCISQAACSFPIARPSGPTVSAMHSPFFSQCHAPGFDGSTNPLLCPTGKSAELFMISHHAALGDLIDTCSLDPVIVTSPVALAPSLGFSVSNTVFSSSFLILIFSNLIHLYSSFHSLSMRFFMPAYHIVALPLHNRTSLSCSSFPYDNHRLPISQVVQV